MTQNKDTTDGLGGSNFATGTGSTGTTGSTGGAGSTGAAGSTSSMGSTGTVGSTGTTSGAEFAGGSHTADTIHPAGDTPGTHTTQRVEAQNYNEGRSTYQPQATTERRSASRPSRSLVIGSAVAGAVAGGALPFMLSGRKSSQTKSVEVDATRPGPSAHADSESSSKGRRGRRR